MKTITVTIIYKSGAKVRLRCKDFVVRSRDGAIVGVEWDTPRPRPLFIGIDEIAAVYEGRA